MGGCRIRPVGGIEMQMVHIRKSVAIDCNKWYHFDRNGYMQIGWLAIRQHWYYLNTDGGMVTGLQMIGGSEYYFVESGEMSVGWRRY